MVSSTLLFRVAFFVFFSHRAQTGVCVKECPSLSDPPVDLSTLVTYSGVYQPNIPLYNSSDRIAFDHVQVANYSSSAAQHKNTTNDDDDDDHIDHMCTVDRCYPLYNPVSAWTSEGINEGAGFAFYAVDTNNYMRRCIASADALEYLRNFTASFDKEMESGPENGRGGGDDGWMSEAYSDIYASRSHVLAFGFGVALVSERAFSVLQRSSIQLRAAT